MDPTPTEDYFSATSLTIDEEGTSSSTSTNLIAEIESQDPLWNETLLDTLWVEEDDMSKMKPELTSTRIKQEHPCISSSRDRRRPNNVLKKKSKTTSISTGLRRGNKRKASSPEVSCKKKSSSTLKSLNKPPPEGYTRTEEADDKLRELEAQLKNLDPNSKEAKKQRRLIRNRMSAQLHRERKKAYVDHLEAELETRDETIAALMREVECLSRENATLVTRLDESLAMQQAQDHHGFTDMLTSEDMLEISQTMMIGPLGTLYDGSTGGLNLDPDDEREEDTTDHHHAFIMPSSPVTDHSDVESIGSSDSPMIGSSGSTKGHQHQKSSSNNNVAMVLAVMLSLTLFGPPQHMLRWIERLKDGQELDFADVLSTMTTSSPDTTACHRPSGRVRILDSIAGTKWDEPGYANKIAIQLEAPVQDRTMVQVLYHPKENNEMYSSFSMLVPTKPDMNNASSGQWLEIGSEVSSKF